MPSLHWIYVWNKITLKNIIISFFHNQYGINSGPDLGLVRPQATVIPRGPPTAPYPNYMNNFIKMLSNTFRVIVILQPFFLIYKFGGPLSPGAPKHCFFCFYVNPALNGLWTGPCTGVDCSKPWTGLDWSRTWTRVDQSTPRTIADGGFWSTRVDCGLQWTKGDRWPGVDRQAEWSYGTVGLLFKCCYREPIERMREIHTSIQTHKCSHTYMQPHILG